MSTLLDVKSCEKIPIQEKEIRLTRKSFIIRKSETRSRARSSITVEDLSSRLGSKRDSISQSRSRGRMSIARDPLEKNKSTKNKQKRALSLTPTKNGKENLLIKSQNP